jgi:hypothetical protein
MTPLVTRGSSRMNCWQIPVDVGDRVRTQVPLYELAEQLDESVGD